MKTALPLSAIGLEMGIAAALGYWLGAWLDRRFDTAPWLMVGTLLLFVAVAFRNLFRLVMQRARDDNQEDEASR